MFFDDFLSPISLFSGDLRSQIWDLGWISYEKTFKLTVLRAQTELGGPPRHGNHPKSTYEWLEPLSGGVLAVWKPPEQKVKIFPGL